MAARGTVAKNNIINKIANIFGNDYITEQNGKVYLWADDAENGRVQIALSLTCPKTQVEIETPTGGFDWRETATPVSTPPKAEITKEEVDNIETMMKRLGL